MKKKYIYLMLSALGLCATWYFNIQFLFGDGDTSLGSFIALTGTTLPAKSIAADITVVCITFFAWLIPESIRLKIKYWWLLIPITLLVAIAFTFPLFLYLRECKLEALASQNE